MTVSHTRTTERRRSRARAFTLVEALIASVVLAFGVSGIATALLTTSQASRSVRQTTIAVGTARTLTETIAAKPIDTTEARANGGTATSPTVANTYAAYADVVSPVTADRFLGQTYARSTVTSFVRRPVSQQLISGSNPPIVATLTQTPASDLAVVKVTVTLPSGATVSVVRLATRVQKE